MLDQQPNELHHDMEGVLSDMDLDTLMGDIRDEMLSRVKQLKATWTLLSQSEQSEVGNGLELFAKNLIRKTVGMLNKHEWPKAIITLEELKIADKGLVGKITAQNIAVNRDAMGEHVGETCMLLMVDSETFFGERAPVKTDPDQPALDLDGDGENDPAEDDERLALPPPTDGEKGKRPARGGKPDKFFGGEYGPNPEDLE